MEHIEKISLLSVIIFLVMGMLHLITPLFFGLIKFGIGMFIFGIFYTTLGFLVYLKNENKIISLLSIICPSVGMILAILILLNTFILYLFSTCIVFNLDLCILLHFSILVVKIQD